MSRTALALIPAGEALAAEVGEPNWLPVAWTATGIAEGARTGLANLLTGALFLAAVFFTPVYEVVPVEAAGAALVIVGALMLGQITNIDFSKYYVALPAFLTIVAMPFTYSITAGIGAGFVAYVLIKVVRGKAAAVHPLMWLVAGLFVLYFAIDPIKDALGV